MHTHGNHRSRFFEFVQTANLRLSISSGVAWPVSCSLAVDR
jgi:hypothetical protein